LNRTTVKPEENTYDWLCYQVLAYEIDEEPSSLAERRIKRKLRSAGLGKYDQSRVDLLRRVRNAIKGEVRLYAKSKFYRGPTGATAGLDDYDFDGLVGHFRNVFPEISDWDMRTIVNFSLYLFYLR
jgi:hypothetical protein